MAARGYRKLEQTWYGRLRKIPIHVKPSQQRNVGLGLLVFVAVMVLFAMSRGGPDAGLIFLLSGVLAAIALFLLFMAVRLSGMEPKFLKLTRTKLTAPKGFFLWSATDHEVALKDIGAVYRVTNRYQTYLELSSNGGKQHIPTAWFETPMAFEEFALLLQLRIDRAKRGATDAVQAAGFEAQVFEGKDALGILVDTSGKRPRARWRIDDFDGYGEVMGRDDFPSDHRLVCPHDTAMRLKAILSDPNTILMALQAEPRPQE